MSVPELRTLALIIDSRVDDEQTGTYQRTIPISELPTTRPESVDLVIR